MAKKIIMKRDLRKQKYSVTLYFHTNITLDAIYAENEQDAIEKAREMAERKVNEKYILQGLQEDNTPVVELVNE